MHPRNGENKVADGCADTDSSSVTLLRPLGELFGLWKLRVSNNAAVDAWFAWLGFTVAMSVCHSILDFLSSCHKLFSYIFSRNFFLVGMGSCYLWSERTELLGTIGMKETGILSGAQILSFSFWASQRRPRRNWMGMRSMTDFYTHKRLLFREGYWV